MAALLAIIAPKTKDQRSDDRFSVSVRHILFVVTKKVVSRQFVTALVTVSPLSAVIPRQ
jgi:hypothetical protein